MLSYFDITGLLRVHVHRGDFALSLKVTENVDLNQKVSLDSPATRPYDAYVDPLAAAFYSLPCESYYYVVSTTSSAMLSGCHSHLCDDHQLHRADATIPHKKLPIRDPVIQNLLLPASF